MNNRLARDGLAYDSKTKTGSEYLFQDESKAFVPKGPVSGTTADMIKVTWLNGQLISVDSVDATSTSKADITPLQLDRISSTINNKLQGQTANVVFTGENEEQARAIAKRYGDNPNVRVIHPASGYDSGELRAGTAGLKAAAQSKSLFVATPKTQKKCPQTPSQSLGRPGAAPRLGLAAFAVRGAADCAEQDEPGGGGLAKALAAPGLAPGGIDFTSLELRYLSDPGDGSGLQYSFSADRIPKKGDPGADSGLLAARETSDAFFVWLELNPSAFWVNLNPNQPDHIVDARLGRTDAGRVLLQADLQLKQDASRITHPDTATGKKYWDGLQGSCAPSRVWIVPAPAEVHQDGDKLYILKAPLDVKMESQYRSNAPTQQQQTACPQQDEATESHNEQLFRTLVLPQLKQDVNSAPQYADLRRVYLARVAAEWYRDLSRSKETSYRDLVNHGDITRWTTATGWKPRDTFDKYVESYTKGDYHLTRSETQGQTTITRTYISGGVDLTKVQLQPVSSGSFDTRYAALPHNVEASLAKPTANESTIMLGAPTPRQSSGLGPPDNSLSVVDLSLRILPVLLVPLAALLLWRRSRRLSTAAAASPLRRAAVPAARTRRNRHPGQGD
ncbi:hypothetical protein ACFXG6_25220 [Streptomyces roseus]|uniref:hypothetical protein n=1 Tax=Streptomyces roseus TaxID=66430 RepID=UPI0036AD3A20